jgi:D-alanyl-D-alanine carboxypeptidase/D-alanyl-D-alanine-endopeptidase (penicillin-binding protein 4)
MTFALLSCSSNLSILEFRNSYFIKEKIENILKGFESNTSIGVKIVSLRSNKVLFSKNEKKLLSPASNMKLLTSAAAIELLTPDFKFKTIIHNHKNNIILTGSGDPTFERKNLDSLAKIISLKFKKIDTLFIETKNMDSLEYGNGWMWDEGSERYSAPINTFIVDNNCINFECFPNVVGKPAIVKFAPKMDEVLLKNQSITVNDTLDFLKLKIERDWINQKNNFSVFGEIEVNSKTDTITKNIHNPNLYNAQLFKKYLISYGLTVDNIRITRNCKKVMDTLAVHESRTLSVILKKMMHESDNQTAEVLIRTLGLKEYQIGSAKYGIKSIKGFLFDRVKIDTSSLRMADGSGLSRYNLLSVHQVINLLSYMNHSPQNETFKNSLPNGGKKGSRLENRMISPGEKIKAKTGSLSGISSLSGYINSKSLGPLAFSIIINGYIGSSDPYHILQDEICEILANN